MGESNVEQQLGKMKPLLFVCVCVWWILIAINRLIIKYYNSKLMYNKIDIKLC